MGNLLTVAAAAARMSVGEKTVYRWFWNGDLTGVKIGRCVRIDEESLNAFLEAHKNGRPADCLRRQSAASPPALAAPRKRARATAGPTVFRYLPPENPAA